jgi:hypothetical protein
MIDHNAGVGDCSIAWNVANVSMWKKIDGVSAFGDASTSLLHAMEFFAHCLEPQISEQGIFDQLSVMSDGFLGDRVYHDIAVFFDFNNRACILIVGKFSRDGDGRGMSTSKFTWRNPSGWPAQPWLTWRKPVRVASTTRINSFLRPSVRPSVRAKRVE